MLREAYSTTNARSTRTARVGWQLTKTLDRFKPLTAAAKRRFAHHIYLSPNKGTELTDQLNDPNASACAATLSELDKFRMSLRYAWEVAALDKYVASGWTAPELDKCIRLLSQLPDRAPNDPDNPDHTAEIRADVAEIARLYRNREASWHAKPRLERDEFTFGHILRLRSSLRTRRM
jgi:hypothetical protein